MNPYIVFLVKTEGGGVVCATELKLTRFATFKDIDVAYPAGWALAIASSREAAINMYPIELMRPPSKSHYTHKYSVDYLQRIHDAGPVRLNLGRNKAGDKYDGLAKLLAR